MRTQERYKDYFKDHYGATFSKADFKQADFLFSQFKFINKIVNLDSYKNKKVLEVGSALGAFAQILMDFGIKNYHGIEVDRDAVNFANKNLGNYFENLALEEIGGKNSYDLIFALEVLEHLNDPSKGIKIIYKLLKKGGTFIGTSPYPFQKNVLGDPTHRYCLHPKNWEKLFAENRFSKIKTYPMSFFPFIWRINKKLNIRIPFYIPMKYFISTTLIIGEK